MSKEWKASILLTISVLFLNSSGQNAGAETHAGAEENVLCTQITSSWDGWQSDRLPLSNYFLPSQRLQGYYICNVICAPRRYLNNADTGNKTQKSDTGTRRFAIVIHIFTNWSPMTVPCHFLKRSRAAMKKQSYDHQKWTRVGLHKTGFSREVCNPGPKLHSNEVDQISKGMHSSYV